MFEESDLLPLSGLQHLVFCERQWGLIHLEQSWCENVLTAEGKVLHERVDDGESEFRGDSCTIRSVRLRSLQLGLAGIADVIELKRTSKDLGGVALPNLDGYWAVKPIEYKRGRQKADNCDAVQLCAQAICLEEMLGCIIVEGAIFYGEPRRRTSIVFDQSLRLQTITLAHRMHTLFSAKITPKGKYEKKCKSCSLFELCRPDKIYDYESGSRFLKEQLANLNEM